MNNYDDTIVMAQSSFLSLTCGESFSSGLRRRSNIHDLPYAWVLGDGVGLRRQPHLPRQVTLLRSLTWRARRRARKSPPSLGRRHIHSMAFIDVSFEASKDSLLTPRSGKCGWRLFPPHIGHFCLMGVGSQVTREYKLKSC